MKRLFLPAFPALGLLLCAAGTSPAQIYYGPGVGPLYSNPYGFRSGGIGYSYNFRSPIATYGLGYSYSPSLGYGLGYSYLPSLGYRYGVYPGVGYSYVPYSYRIDPGLYRAPVQGPDLWGPDDPGYLPPTAPRAGLTGDLSGTRRAFYPPGPLRAGRPPAEATPAPGRARARLTVRVPAGAELWFGDYKVKQTGGERTFQTPPLEAGLKYAYKVRMRWTDGGEPREVSREIDVRAGEDRTIDLLKEE